MIRICGVFCVFFFNDTATTEIYTLSLHDALPISAAFTELGDDPSVRVIVLASEYEKYFSVGADLTMLGSIDRGAPDAADQRSEEHTSELQSQSNLVCRLLLEKKKKTNENKKRSTR